MNIQLSAEEWRLVAAALADSAELRRPGFDRCSALAERIKAALNAPAPVDGVAYEAKYLQKALATRHA